MFKLFLFAPIVVLGFIFIVLPIIRYIKTLAPPKRDTLAEAKERLEVARKELEAARLNKEAEKLYEELYEEALEDYDSEMRNSNGEK